MQARIVAARPRGAGEVDASASGNQGFVSRFDGRGGEPVPLSGATPEYERVGSPGIRRMGLDLLSSSLRSALSHGYLALGILASRSRVSSEGAPPANEAGLPGDVAQPHASVSIASTTEAFMSNLRFDRHEVNDDSRCTPKVNAVTLNSAKQAIRFVEPLRR